MGMTWSRPFPIIFTFAVVHEAKLPLTNGASFIAPRKSRGVATIFISFDTMFIVSTIDRANIYFRDDGSLFGTYYSTTTAAIGSNDSTHSAHYI